MDVQPTTDNKSGIKYLHYWLIFFKYHRYFSTYNLWYLRKPTQDFNMQRNTNETPRITSNIPYTSQGAYRFPF